MTDSAIGFISASSGVFRGGRILIQSHLPDRCPIWYPYLIVIFLNHVNQIDESFPCPETGPVLFLSFILDLLPNVFAKRRQDESHFQKHVGMTTCICDAVQGSGIVPIVVYIT